MHLGKYPIFATCCDDLLSTLLYRICRHSDTLQTFFVICCGIYIPPGLHKAEHDTITDYLSSKFDEFLSMHPNDKLVLAGDTNDFKTDFLMENFNLIDRVDGATRKDSILDHIWLHDDLSDVYPNFADVGPPLSSSDHNCVFLKPVCATYNPNSCRSALVWDFRDSHVSDFLQKLTTTDFNSIEREHSF